MSAKDRFLKLPQAKAFADIALSEPLQTALDYAILEMQDAMPREDTAEKACFAHSRMSGALRLRQLLETIAFPEVETKPTKAPTINYDAYNKPARA